MRNKRVRNDKDDDERQQVEYPKEPTRNHELITNSNPKIAPMHTNPDLQVDLPDG
jgi:hypothetical protein